MVSNMQNYIYIKKGTYSIHLLACGAEENRQLDKRDLITIFFGAHGVYLFIYV
jgi:hypothetical protein